MTREKSGPGNRAEKASAQKSNQKEVVSLGHLSQRQVAVLMTYILGVKSLLITPASLIISSGSGAWITSIVSSAFAFLGLWGWVLWSKATSDLAFVPAVRKTVGRYPGDIIVGAGILLYIFATAMSARIFAGGAVIGLLPRFPIEVLLGIALGASAYTAWLGLEHVARAGTFFFAPILISVFGLIIASYKSLDVRNLFPILGLGQKVVFSEGLRLVGLWGGLPVFVILKSYVRNQESLSKGAFKGLLWASLGMVFSVLLVLMFFSYPAATRFAHPVGILARSVHFGRFFERFEAAFVFTWFFASAVQISFSYMYILITLSQLSNLHTYRPFMPSLITLIFGLAALPSSMLEAGELLNTWFFRSAGIVAVGFGWVLYFLNRIRGKTKCLQRVDTHEKST